ncbi:hypothetical protein [Enterovibrio norvegicus]|uniref:hypothetical protein n=1 Tax=Enterovibrio norvegicus TaxID=188144 RepID=UPI000C859CE6|nr:hypothetical protein [Enterovibrio norvegicus]PMI33623.1 hypothetical protein BCU47_09265 [Enterovibrio norvegicus]
MEKIIISDIDELIRIIIDTGKTVDFVNIDFTGLYTDVGFKLSGDEDRLNGALNSTICKGLSDFHNDLLKAYCIVKYNSDNLKQLKAVERQKLELVFTVEAGCTDILVAAKDFCDSLKQAVESVTTDMTGSQKTALFLTAILSVGGYYALDSYNTRKSTETAAQSDVTLSENTANKEIALAQIERQKMDSLITVLENSIKSNSAANERAIKFKSQAEKAYHGIIKQSLLAGAKDIHYRGATNVSLDEEQAKELVVSNKKKLDNQNGIHPVEITSIRWTDAENLSVTARSPDSVSTFIMSVDTTYVDKSELDILINDGFGSKDIIYVSGSFKVRGGFIEKAIASGIYKDKPEDNEI